MPKPLSRRNFLSRAATTATLTHALGVEQAAHAAPDTTPRPLPPYRPTPKQIAAAYERVQADEALARPPVLNARVDAHWFGENDAAFWYRRDGWGGAHEFILVDTEKGTRQPAFDHIRLAQGVARTVGKPIDAAHLAFSVIYFVPDSASVRFELGGQTYECRLTDYVCTKSDAPMPRTEPPTPPPGPARRGRRNAEPAAQETMFLKNNNVWARTGSNGDEIALTQTGTTEKSFGRLIPSPDKQAWVGFRKTEVPIAPVYMVESSPKATTPNAGTPYAGFRGVLHQHAYAQPGDPFPEWEMWVFQPDAKTAFPVQIEVFTGEYPPDVMWQGGTGSHFLFTVPDRGHQRFRVLEAEAASGKTRVILDEKTSDPTKTFINTSNTTLYITQDGQQFLYASERDGWRHLYRYDVQKGSLANQVTRGPWVVRSVERVDEEAALVYFWASGKNENEDPYNLHLYRVGFDGTGLTEITGGNGSHSVQFSPLRRFVIDTYSLPDLPPVHTLRRADTGTQVCPLEKADITALQKNISPGIETPGSGSLGAGWRAPEVFSAKGRDGQTDIWGIVFRPRAFDPAKRYPVIENIYAGPQDSFVRKTFAVRDAMQVLADLGFIVVQCDGMGTRNRSKAFHDVCWRNLKDAGLPDRIAWIKALARKYPYCDTSRVGIYGTSAGGQNVGSALLFQGDFYKVGVASCGCHDNRIDKQWWNEQWMGYPVGPWYDACSNITNAPKLRGKLLLMVGELDSNVPPESTLRFADALIKADKDFDLLVLPGLNHTSGGAYGERRRRDYFVRHLLGVEPPDRNAPRPPAPAVKPVMLPPHPVTDTYLAAGESSGDTTILFRNQTNETVRLFWLQDGGSRTAYATIAPGKSYEQHTFAGHVWLVTGANEREIVLFVGDTRPGIAEIKPVP